MIGQLSQTKGDWNIQQEVYQLYIGRLSNFQITDPNEFLGCTMQICSKSEWGSTSTVLMFMLYWREQMIGNCTTYLLRKTRPYSEHLIHSHDDVSILELTPTEIYDVT